MQRGPCVRPGLQRRPICTQSDLDASAPQDSVQCCVGCDMWTGVGTGPGWEGRLVGPTAAGQELTGHIREAQLATDGTARPDSLDHCCAGGGAECPPWSLAELWPMDPHGR